jgi:hypothetical protein
MTSVEKKLRFAEEEKARLAESLACCESERSVAKAQCLMG